MQNFDTTALIKAVCDRRGFLLVQGMLDVSPDGQKYNVFVSKETKCAVLPEERKGFENPHESLWRMGAGGGLMVLHLNDCSVALMRYRDKSAPSYGDHWTLGSGLTASVEEIVHPIRVAVRECVEEFGILTPHGIVIPTFGDDMLDAISRGAVRSNTFFREIALPSGFDTGKYLLAEASFRDLASESELTVSFEDAGSVSTRGIVVVDPNTRGIDLLKVVDLRLPYSLDEIVVMDGEEDRRGKPLNGVVGAMHVNEPEQDVPFDVIYQNGARQNPDGFVLKNMTPTLRSVVGMLR